MNARQLTDSVTKILSLTEKVSAFVWGPPGIGKSAIINAAAANLDLEVIDLRLGQIPPADLRGLPYIDNGVSKYARPEWLREDGRGVLFLDELPNAAPTVQGLAQQLLLNRRIGEHKLGDGWYIIGAGNGREHGAAVHAMPSPVANRLIHFTLEADLDSWKPYALSHGISAEIIGFLSFRPELLYRLDKKRPAFPSPRSWEVAGKLHELGMSIDPAVGRGVADEFRVYLEIVSELPDLQPILDGNGEDIDFPEELSCKYAVCVGLALRCQDEKQAISAFEWLWDRTGPEWIQLYIADLLVALRERSLVGRFASMAYSNKNLRRFVHDSLVDVLA
jgi:hypothetical protein